MAYSTDLRERVIAATRTMDKRKVAAVFQISYSTVKRWASLGAGVKPNQRTPVSPDHALPAQPGWSHTQQLIEPLPTGFANLGNSPLGWCTSCGLL